MSEQYKKVTQHHTYKNVSYKHVLIKKEHVSKTRRELSALRKDGSKIPVEVGLNPYMDHEIPLILVTIIERTPDGSPGPGMQPSH